MNTNTVNVFNFISSLKKEILLKDTSLKEGYFQAINIFFELPNFDISLTNKQVKYFATKLNEIQDRLLIVCDRLQKNKETRQAILQFDILNSRIPECFVSMQFQIIHDVLYCTVVSRSMDLLGKAVVDFAIAKEISALVKLKFPSVTIYKISFFVGNLHFYEK